MRVVLPLGVVTLLAAVCVTTASAATPAAYRTKVNGICRSYTPKLKQIDAQMSTAQTKNDFVAFGVALGKLLTLSLQQDAKIEAVPVPAALQPRMRPILALLRKIDTHARAALKDAQTAKAKEMLNELLTIGDLAKPLNKQLDAAGLKDCGSNQS
jgi:hypothetical protein